MLVNNWIQPEFILVNLYALVLSHIEFLLIKFRSVFIYLQFFSINHIYLNKVRNIIISINIKLILVGMILSHYFITWYDSYTYEKDHSNW